jgi:hypothetical protein
MDLPTESPLACAPFVPTDTRAMEPGDEPTTPEAGAPDTATPDPIAAETADTASQRRRLTNRETPTMTASPD